MMLNSIENVEAWFGLQKAGHRRGPGAHRLPRAALRYVVDHADARALVVDEAFLPHLAAIADGLPQLEHVIVNRGEPGDGRSSCPPGSLAVHDLADLYDDRAPAADAATSARATPAVVLHSSGTTGPPKGVVLSHDAVLHLTRHLVWLMGYTGDDRLYTAFPLFHNNAKYTSVSAALEAGGRRDGQAVPRSRVLGGRAREGDHRVQLHGRAR